MPMHAADVIEVVEALQEAGVDVWLDGGWGVDALLEKQTREHDDLDVVVGVDHVSRLIVVLANLGFTEIKTWPGSPEVIVLRDPNDRRVDVHPVRFDIEGNGVQKIEGGREWTYPAAGFAGAGTVEGRSVRCLTPEVQILCHAGYELDEDDVRDIAALRARFGLS
jgi:lincosamide nucleotidyltransferase A/C/D/E